MGPRIVGLADVGGEERATDRIEREAVRPSPDADLDDGARVPGIDDPDGVFGAIGREDEVGVLGDEGPGNAGQPVDRLEVPQLVEVDDIDRIVGRVGDVQPSTAAVNGGMVEAALTAMLREIDIPLEPKCHEISRH